MSGCIGREIKQHYSVLSNRTEPYLIKLSRTLNLIVLIGVIKPAGSYRNVNLRGNIPLTADNSFVVTHACHKSRMKRRYTLLIGGGVVRFPRISRLVSAPSYVYVGGCADRSKHNRVGLMISYDISPVAPIVRGLTASRGIPPYLVNMTVLCAKLLQLLCIIMGILVCSPIFRVSVPRGNIETYFDVILAAGVNEFAYNITLAVLVRAVLYRMLSIF